MTVKIIFCRLSDLSMKVVHPFSALLIMIILGALVAGQALKGITIDYSLSVLGGGNIVRPRTKPALTCSARPRPMRCLFTCRLLLLLLPQALVHEPLSRFCF